VIKIGDMVKVENQFTRPGVVVLAEVVSIQTPLIKVRFFFGGKQRTQTVRIADVK